MTNPARPTSAKLKTRKELEADAAIALADLDAEGKRNMETITREARERGEA